MKKPPPGGDRAAAQCDTQTTRTTTYSFPGSPAQLHDGPRRLGEIVNEIVRRLAASQSPITKHTRPVAGQPGVSAAHLGQSGEPMRQHD